MVEYLLNVFVLLPSMLFCVIQKVQRASRSNTVSTSQVTGGKLCTGNGHSFSYLIFLNIQMTVGPIRMEKRGLKKLMLRLGGYGFFLSDLCCNSDYTG